MVVKRRKELAKKRLNRLKESGHSSASQRSSLDKSEVKELTRDETYECFKYQQDLRQRDLQKLKRMQPD